MKKKTCAGSAIVRLCVENIVLFFGINKSRNEGYRCPAERLNGKRYAEDWLENLLVATSAVQKRKPPQNPA